MQKDKQVEGEIAQKRVSSLKFDDKVDDLFLEEVQFRPITEGLGFHRPETKDNFSTNRNLSHWRQKGNLSQNSTLPQLEVPALNRSQKSGPANIGLKTKIDGHRHMGDLQAFYGDEVGAKEQKKINSQVEALFDGNQVGKEVKLIKASLSKDIGSLCIDFFCVILILSAIVALGFLLFSKFNPLTKGELLHIIGQEKILWGIFILCSQFLYFVLLDSTSGQTLGKELLGVTLFSDRGKKNEVDKERINITSSFLRVFWSMVFLLLGGIPFYWGWHNKLSHSILMEKKKH